MANFDVSNSDFSTELRKLETSDQGHANTFNPLFERLIKNDDSLNKKIINIKVPVTSVNGKTGDIEIQPSDIKIGFNNFQLTLDIYLKELHEMVKSIKGVNVSENEPDNAKEDDVWIDTNEKIIKVRKNNIWIKFGAAYL